MMCSPLIASIAKTKQQGERGIEREEKNEERQETERKGGKRAERAAGKDEWEKESQVKGTDRIGYREYRETVSREQRMLLEAARQKSDIEL